jgi:uncharacterized protein (DUF433 family)
MSRSASTHAHISMDQDGSACIDQTRYKVLHLAGEHYHHGWSAEELQHQHPDLRPEQIYAALTWFYDHYDDMVAQLKASAAAIERLRAGQTLSRSELMRRRQAAG